MRQVARAEWTGEEPCLDWTQAEQEARLVKKQADAVRDDTSEVSEIIFICQVHDDYLRRRRELKKRKSEVSAVINKQIKREDFEEKLNEIEDHLQAVDAPINGRKCKKTDSYKIEADEIERLLEGEDRNGEKLTETTTTVIETEESESQSQTPISTDTDRVILQST